MELSLEGKVALVTGASREIGAAVARRLAEAGADVAVGYGGDRGSAQKLVSEIKRTGGRQAVAIGGDPADPAQVSDLARGVEETLGPVDVLVSNAGIARRQSFEEITVEDWDETMNVNLRAAFLIAQRLAPGMRDRGWGRIVFVSSVVAFTGGIIGAHYNASKAALISLAHALAAPLAPQGVTVNAVAPALIAQSGTISGDGENERRAAGRIPVGRFGKPEEVAETALMLATNPFITAQTVSVDGGLYPR